MWLVDMVSKKVMKSLTSQHIFVLGGVEPIGSQNAICS